VSGHHDLGGTQTGAPISREEHAVLPWELRVDALMRLLSDPNRPGGALMTVDELRRGIEALSPEAYRSLGYYEKWLQSMIAIMTEKGVIDPGALELRLAEVEREHADEHAHEHAEKPSHDAAL
jgi:hypothetical protein